MEFHPTLKCVDELSEPLSICFNKSLSEGTIPDIFKCAAVVPICKGGDRSIPANYRPVSLTSVIMKVFEKIVRKAIVSHLDVNDVMNSTQHGFRKGRSCISALLGVYDEIMHSLMDPEVQCVDMILLDFSKAFDRVDHHILLHILKSYGITKQLGTWISQFLIGRSQYVQIPGENSYSNVIVSGVPQGTVLGPVLFLAIIADINKDVTYSSVSSFADDTRMYKSVKCPTDCDNLQKDLNVVYEWATENNKKFNIEKFQYVCYHTKHSVNMNNVYLSPSHDMINPVESLRDLGVIMANFCCFNAHIDKTDLSCSRLIGWILRTFSKRDKCTLLTLFKAVVRPLLEYACQLWSPAQ